MRHGNLYSYSRYLKKFKKKRTYDVFGPTKVKPPKLKTSGNSILKLGGNYQVKVPLGEKPRYWNNSWNGKSVELLGFQQLFYQGSQIVCVERNKKFLTLPANWITVVKKTGCSCSTSIIWAKGCQCGGA